MTCRVRGARLLWCPHGCGHDTMLILDTRDVWRCLPMPEAIDAMSAALRIIAEGSATAPLRAQLGVDDHDGTMLVMPVHAGAADALAVKIASVYPGNAARGLPVVTAVVVALDPQYGVPLALLEGGALTAIRSRERRRGATRVLARRDCETLAILGAGVQAHAHALAMCAVRDVRELRLWARRDEQAEDLAIRLREQDDLRCSVRVCASADDAVSGARLVCTTTAASEALFAAHRIDAGAHINAVGAFQRDMQEVPDACVRRARVFVDHLPSAMEEAGDILGPIARGVFDAGHVAGEVGAVLAGRLEGRRDAVQVTLFKSVGHAVEDGCAASLALANARRMGLGRHVQL